MVHVSVFFLEGTPRLRYTKRKPTHIVGPRKRHTHVKEVGLTCGKLELPEVVEGRSDKCILTKPSPFSGAQWGMRESKQTTSWMFSPIASFLGQRRSDTLRMVFQSGTFHVSFPACQNRSQVFWVASLRAVARSSTPTSSRS